MLDCDLTLNIITNVNHKSSKELEILLPYISPALARPLFAVKVNAGFPSPGGDYVEKSLDLNEHLIQHKEATFYVRAIGDSMIDGGTKEGDLLIVDRALTAKNGSIILAVLFGEFTVKRLKIHNGKMFLMAENKKYDPIEITEEMEFQVWGVVSNIIHNCL